MNLFAIFFLVNTAVLIEGGQFRLSTQIKPLVYSLKIHPDLDGGTFKGEVFIQLQAKFAVSSIVLHSRNLSISDLLLNQRRHDIIYNLQPEFDLIEVSYANQTLIAPGNHNLYIKYKGLLLEKTTGFFKARFVSKKNVSYSAVTDFQPTHAREAFPCFDEPSFKARFQVTLVAPNSSYTALSNMRPIAHFQSSEGIVYKFETSFVMSSYLVAFAITQYTYGEIILGYHCKNVPIRVYSLGANFENNADPIRYAASSIQFYSNYTKFNYPLPKIDMIEYERNQSGATENWGLITAKLGVLSPSLGIYDKTQIVDVISHEIAHYWFGNLVTNNWWDDIWLQEGFAVFMALKAQDYILNSRESSKNFASQYLEDVYVTDQQQPSSAIVTYLETPQDIEKHFNDITYMKGAALLRMVEMVLGEDKFKQVLRCYIKRFAFKTATSNDFINIVQESDPETDLRSFMATYLFQNRYPLINVREDEDLHVYNLTQISCTLKVNESASPFSYKWTIPLTYTTNLKPKPQLIWFHRDMNVLQIPRGLEKWIKFNHDQIGFYRVNYSSNLWANLLENLQEINEVEKTHLLAESVQLYIAGVLPCQVSLLLMEKLSQLKKGLPQAPFYVFIIYAGDEIAPHDKEAYKTLEKHLKMLLKNSGSRSTRRIRRRNIVESASASSQDQVPQRVLQCVKWIKENL